jgi:hypothetical protein
MEYHLSLALITGTVTTLDAEYVLDLRKWQWYKVDRGTGKRLQCGLNVVDGYGNNYSYGFIDEGYCERLEYGTTFDGNDIVSSLWTGDFMLGQEPFNETEVSAIIPVMAAKTLAPENLTITHYVNSATTGTDYTIDPKHTGYGLAFPVTIVNSVPGVFHSFRMEFTTGVETYGFEPFVIGILSHKKRALDYAT